MNQLRVLRDVRKAMIGLKLTFLTLISHDGTVKVKQFENLRISRYYLEGNSGHGIFCKLKIIRNHSFSTYAKLAEKLTSLTSSRSCRPEVFCKKDALRNFAKFTGKHLCKSLFFNKVADLRPATLLKEVLAQVFSSEFCEISKNVFLQNTSGRLLLLG